jgi:hypothetical protein
MKSYESHYAELGVGRVAIVLTAFIAAAPTFVTAPAMAQQASEGSLSGGLEEIVVTARRRSEDLQSEPVSITVRNAATSDGTNWPGSDKTNIGYVSLHGNLGSLGEFDFRSDYSPALADILSGQMTIPSAATVAYFGSSPAYDGAPFQYSNTRSSALNLAPIGPLSVGQQVPDESNYSALTTVEPGAALGLKCVGLSARHIELLGVLLIPIGA